MKCSKHILYYPSLFVVTTNLLEFISTNPDNSNKCLAYSILFSSILELIKKTKN